MSKPTKTQAANPVPTPPYPLDYTLEIASMPMIRALNDLMEASTDPLMKLAASVAQGALIQIRDQVTQPMMGDRHLLKIREMLKELPGDLQRENYRSLMPSKENLSQFANVGAAYYSREDMMNRKPY